MTTTNQPLGTTTTLTVTGLSTLAVATYAVSAALDVSTNKPVGLSVIVSVTPNGAPTGNKLIKVFVKPSLDGTTYGSGPETGTTTTDENQLRQIGVVRVTTSSQVATEVFEISQAFNFQPYFQKLIFFNDCGVALSAATVSYREVSSQNA